MQLLLPQTRYADAGAMIAFYRRLPTKSPRFPAVTASAVATTLPMTGSDIGMGFAPEGRAPDPERPHVGGASSASAPTTSRTMGIPIVRGRGFTERDDERAPRSS